MDKNTCDNDCKNCSADCGERDALQKEKKRTDKSDIKKVIGIMSGKGGVGKSLVTSLLAINMRRREYQTAILDADLTGPSIPRAFGVDKKADASDLGIFPVETKTGIKLMSINLLLQNTSDPVVWRGPILSGTVKQFWTEVYWNDVDYMFIDMPPGTGDVPLTVYQSLPVDGIIIVTSPQELVSMIVKKSVKMARMMKIPVLGIVENMSYFVCPNCGQRIYLFGEGGGESLAKELETDLITRIPQNPQVMKLSEDGKPACLYMRGTELETVFKELAGYVINTVKDKKEEDQSDG